MKAKTLSQLSGITRRTQRDWMIVSKSNVTVLHNDRRQCKAVINYKDAKAVVQLNHLTDLLRIVKQVEQMEDAKREFFIT